MFEGEFPLHTCTYTLIYWPDAFTMNGLSIVSNKLRWVRSVKIGNILVTSYIFMLSI